MLNPTTIKEYAYSLGFDTARITSAEALPEAERVIRERIAEGLMEGLPWFTAERAEVSCYPDALLPGAQSIITLAMFYLTEQPDETQDDVPRGRISRYAWVTTITKSSNPGFSSLLRGCENTLVKRLVTTSRPVCS